VGSSGARVREVVTVRRQTRVLRSAVAVGWSVAVWVLPVSRQRRCVLLLIVAVKERNTGRHEIRPQPSAHPHPHTHTHTVEKGGGEGGGGGFNTHDMEQGARTLVDSSVAWGRCRTAAHAL